MIKSRLYIFVGAPGCGKTTWIKKNYGVLFDASKSLYISRDAIRLEMLSNDEEYFFHEKEVFNKMVDKIVDGLSIWNNIFVDATHLNHASRAKLINAINRKYSEPYEVVFVFFDTCLATCIQRNALREGRECVPADALRQMFNRMTVPTVGEFPNCVGVWMVRE